ncbi:MAG: TrmO family methyltransferase [Coriobacteriia bacterium]|nr:TrmO family methyltransferase [Coriobacteriia bacterium]
MKSERMAVDCVAPGTWVPMQVVAHIRTDFPQKFGIPCQSGMVPEAQGRIVFEPEFAVNSAVKGLEGFSHLWLLWQFENGRPGGGAADLAADAAGAVGAAGEPGAEAAPGDVAAGNASAPGAAAAPASGKRAWSPTVRPPRLGGATRMGVFATRSPFHPNPLGLSCVRLERVELTDAGPVLHVRGADLRDNTPIFDVKPYVPYADCQPAATGGFTEGIVPTVSQANVPAELMERVPEQKRAALLQVLENDPRPVGRHKPGRVYELAFAGLHVSFVGDADVLDVVDVRPLA